jgi:hypothetical protein
VLLSFRPRVGSTYDYDVRVTSVTTRHVEGRPSQTTREEARFRAHQTVLRADRSGIRVRVELRRPGTAPRTYVVRYDRAAQLEAIESVEGIPVASLGGLGVSEIFPAAAGAPPDRPLALGDRWAIDDVVRLPGDVNGAHLLGSGRLNELGVVDGHDVARIATRSTLPVESATGTAASGAALVRHGTLVTDNKATHDIADGSVRELTSRTRGRFDIVIRPPSGVTGTPVNGTLDVEVDSETVRVR